MALSLKSMSEVLSLENRALLLELGQVENALTRNSVDRLREIVRSFEERLLLHHRREEEALYPAMAKHLPGHGEPLTRRRIMIQECEERLRDLRGSIQRGYRGKYLYEGHMFALKLRTHLLGADNVLLPLAERLLSQEDWGRVRKGFESIRSMSRPVAPGAGIPVGLPATPMLRAVAAS